MVNIWAIIVAAVASFAVGMLWYGPLFGKIWMKMMNITPKSMKNMKMTPAVAMCLGFLAALVTAYVISQFVSLLNVAGFGAAVQLAFWIWLGFIAMTQIGAVLWEGRSWKLFLLNAGHTLVNTVVMTAIIAAWP